ncbi:amidoligase family protein [Nocardia sp. NPDC056100]|uniref:amidoligase family protein n=1 Tax=Nocardia sp. NPDC056100 TaxID=3345712 RepID=UPI0035DC6E4A
MRAWFECEQCQRYTPSGSPTIDDGMACDRCADLRYWRCSDCRLLARSVRHVDNGEQVCVDCEDDYRECAECDHLTNCGTYCSHCAIDDHDDRVFDHSYKPDPVFHGAGPVYLGLELELKTSGHALEDCVDAALSQLRGLGYLKEDGSIGYGNGFELVTHPMSYDWALEHFPWPVLREMRSRGAYIDDGVGIHVHVSREGFTSPAHVYRWMKFIYRNESWATRLARRSSDEWASFDPDMRAEIAHFAKGDRFGYGRYHAINVCPRDTLEVRIFASSLDPQQVQAALAFVAASVEYTRTLTSGDVATRRGWEWTAFVTWVRRHPIYLPLLAEMEALQCAS